jgi:hypothetical protein
LIGERGFYVFVVRPKHLGAPPDRGRHRTGL